MELYEYSHVCPDCGKDWVERKLKPLDFSNEKKLCVDCKNSSTKKSSNRVKDNGGFKNNDMCGSCKHFQSIDDENEEKDKLGKPWGKCALGCTNPNIQEYTLTWAIDNLEECPISIEEYEDYGNERLDLVHYWDVCDKYEEEDDS